MKSELNFATLISSLEKGSCFPNLVLDSICCLFIRGAKSLINKPKLLFLDEPTASLDPDVGDFVRAYLEKYKEENELTILLASHNMKEVERLCDSIVMMKKGEIVGTLGQSGRATGPHLDIRLNWFEVKLDPASVLNLN